MMTAGIVAGAIASTVEVPMDFIAVSSWKAAVGLGGNASKASVRQWAENLGGSIVSQDAADALGIASAAACRVDGWSPTCWVDPPNYG
jgi:Holliday junction resolvasome RuvABC endonuclease subunit